MEADVYPLDDPDRAIEIDGTIGEGSYLHDTYGYYAHGVGAETAARGAEPRAGLVDPAVLRLRQAAGRLAVIPSRRQTAYVRAARLRV
jgi:hypothetical protein